jgi:serine protease inhibitor
LTVFIKAALFDFQEKNAAVAPFSVLTGLGLLYEGMGDRSRSKVSLGFPSSHETFLKMFRVSCLKKN